MNDDNVYRSPSAASVDTHSKVPSRFRRTLLRGAIYGMIVMSLLFVLVLAIATWRRGEFDPQDFRALPGLLILGAGLGSVLAALSRWLRSAIG